VRAACAAETRPHGRTPKPPDEDPPLTRQLNLTEPDSALMRRCDAREYRLASTAQAAVSTSEIAADPRRSARRHTCDARCCARSILRTQAGIGLPDLVLAAAGLATDVSVPALEA
jgi:hypothetical protein